MTRSAGCILYELIEGKQAYDKESFKQIKYITPFIKKASFKKMKPILEEIFIHDYRERSNSSEILKVKLFKDN